MCGRYTLTADQEALSAALGVSVLLADHPTPRFNIAPTQEAPVWVNADPGAPSPVRRLQWGLVPAWANTPSRARPLINARAETVATLPSFRDAFQATRCLVPVDGFYEWTSGEGRQPWWIHRPDRQVFTLAGLHARWRSPEDGAPLDTFTILTRSAAGGIRRLHHRMPVVVAPELRASWLDSRGTAEGKEDAAAPPVLASLLEAVLEAAEAAGQGLDAHPVSRAVNGPGQDEPSLIQPAPPPPQRSLFDAEPEPGGENPH